jgi:urease accessory protein
VDAARPWAGERMIGDLGWLRLLQLASPALPVGAFTYSQGQEQAIAAGIVHDEPSAAAWIRDALRFGLARWELPVQGWLHEAWLRGDMARVQRLDAEFRASRETAELRAETLQMGHSLARLLRELPAFRGEGDFDARLAALQAPSYPTVWAAAAAAWRVPAGAALEAYAWSWLENQVLAAVKTVPLGHSAGQRLQADIAADIPGLANRAREATEDDVGNWNPGLALASATHETQYSRLFRS